MAKLYTFFEGYLIVFKYLDKYWEQTKLEDLGALLGSMDPNTFTDHQPADQGLLKDWATITHERTDLTLEECFDYMIHFIEKQNEWLDLKQLLNYLNEVKRKGKQDWKDFIIVNET